MKKFTSKGLTLIELFLALAIIAIIWVVATRYYQTVKLSGQVNDAISMVQALRAAVANYASGQPKNTAVDFATLSNVGLLPSDFGAAGNFGQGTNPWGGNVTLAGTVGNFTITMDNMPAQGCQNMLAKFQNQISNDGTESVNCGGSTFTAQFA
ncbi:MAG: type 4 pilus major pilin [Pseudomonadota bacterium]